MHFSRIIIATVLLLVFAVAGKNSLWLPSVEAADTETSEIDSPVEGAVADTATADEAPLPATTMFSSQEPATIYYTTNGPAPSTLSPSGSEAVDTAPPRIRAQAGGTLLDTTNVNRVTVPVTVIFSANEPVTVYYTTNGTDPTTATPAFAKIESANDTAAGPIISGFDFILVTLGEDTAGNLTSIQSYTFTGP